MSLAARVAALSSRVAAEFTTVRRTVVTPDVRGQTWEQSIPPAPKGLLVHRAGNDYFLSWHMSDNLWARVRIAGQTTPGSDGPMSGGAGVHQIVGVDVWTPAGGTVNEATVLGETTGAWSSATSGSVTWVRTNTGGDSLTHTMGSTVAGPASIRVAEHGSHGGVARVAINGNWTAATNLPTAQDLVTSGVLASTALTTGGGTLDPTHRVLYMYAAATLESSRLLSPSVPAGAVVRVEHTGYFRSAAAGTATNQRIGIVGFSYSSGVGAPESSEPFVVDTLSTKASAWEIATKFDNGVTSSFMGMYHGYVHESSLAVTVDGVTTAVADGAKVLAGREVVLTAVGEIRYPVDKIADYVIEWRLTSEGLVIHPTVTWRTAGTVRAAYAMASGKGPAETGARVTRATTSRHAAEAFRTIPAAEGSFYYADAASPTSALVFTTDAAAGYLLTHRVLDYAQWRGTWPTERRTAIEGRLLVGSSTTSVVKVYNSRIKDDTGAGRVVTDGSVDEYTALLRVGYFPTGVPGSFGPQSQDIEPYTFAISGAVPTTQPGKSRIYLEGNYVIDTVRAAVNTTPTTALVVDVNKNGTTVYTTQGNRPSIAAGGFSATGGTPDVFTFAAGDYLTVDVDAGAGAADLTVNVRMKRV